MTLTIKSIEAAKPKDKAYKLTDAHGLYLYVAKSGGKSWRTNYSRDGRQQTRTYGRWPEMSLSDARRAHQTARGPLVVQEVSQDSPTFKSVALEWLKIKLPSLRNGKHQIQVANTLERFVYPSIGHLPINRIDRKQLVEVVRQVQEMGKKIETAHRVAGRITAVFDFAQDTGLLDVHGAAGLVRVLIPRKVKKPMACIPISETGELICAINSYEEPITRLGLKLLAYTFVRVGEITGMRWDELREDGAIWIVPERRMKSGPPHVVPLSKQARAVLDELRLLTAESSELVLESPIRPGRPISENTLLFALYRLGYRGRMTAHGFRSLASTVLNEQSGFAPDVIERQLSHKESDAVRAAYNRAQYLDARRDLMQWWGDWLDSLDLQ